MRIEPDTGQKCGSCGMYDMHPTDCGMSEDEEGHKVCRNCDYGLCENCG